jgi:hypothetical protein
LSPKYIGKNHNLLIANKSFENMAKFQHFGINVTNKNCICEEIKSRLNVGNACYHSLQSLILPSPNNIKVKVHKTIILPVILYGCETLSLTLREEHRLKVFENRMLRRIFEHKREDGVRGWKRLHE